MTRGAHRRGERGQAAVEMALVLPVLLLLVFGVIAFGRAYNAQLTVQNAAREGVRLAAVGGSDTDVQQRVRAVAPGLDPNKLVIVETRDTQNQVVTVRVTYPVTIVGGYIAQITGGTITVGAKSSMAYTATVPNN